MLKAALDKYGYDTIVHSSHIHVEYDIAVKAVEYLINAEFDED